MCTYTNSTQNKSVHCIIYSNSRSSLNLTGLLLRGNIDKVQLISPRYKVCNRVCSRARDGSRVIDLRLLLFFFSTIGGKQCHPSFEIEIACSCLPTCRLIYTGEREAVWRMSSRCFDLNVISTCEILFAHACNIKKDMKISIVSWKNWIINGDGVDELRPSYMRSV